MIEVLLLLSVLFQLEQNVLDKNKKAREAEEAKREKERLEEMRRKEQSRIMDVCIVAMVTVYSISFHCFISHLIL